MNVYLDLPQGQGGLIGLGRLIGKTSALLAWKIDYSERAFSKGAILTKRVCSKVLLIKQLNPQTF